MEERPKFVKPIEFTRTSTSTFTCPAGTHPGWVYAIHVTPTWDGENVQVFCSCQGSMRRGPDTCKHAKELRAQGLHRGPFVP